MVTKLCLRTHSLPFTIFSSPIQLFPKFSLPRQPIVLSIFSIASSAAAAECLPYGPSLHKGKTPSYYNPKPHSQQVPIIQCQGNEQQEEQKESEETDNGVLDEEKFTRIFDVAALRVPAKECFALESRLRGHLLNWPRMRNIARVPGDEVEQDIVNLLGHNNADGYSIDSLNRRLYGKAEGDGERLSPVLYREKLARTFNWKGYARFRHLAKISRPRRKSKEGKGAREEGEEEELRKKKGKNDFAVVEVVEEEDGKEMTVLMGEGFRGRTKWKGSTRLLLLDEQYADKGLEELPEAIKMNEILEALLPKCMIIPSAFEMVGHIAHLNLRDEHLPYKKLIAKVVLDKNKPKIRTVVNKIDAIQNDYRTMQLEVLAGNHSLVTTVVENGLRFHIDLATVYWNSRLATERQRLLNGFNHSDVVCDVFSGVGPIAVSAAKIVKRVYANDLNPYAVEYLEKNSVLNKLERKIEVFNMDGRRFINAMFASEKAQSVTQVVMNLPNDAAEFLDAFKGMYRDRPKDMKFSFPMIHVYGFSKAQDPEFDFHERIRIALSEAAVDVEMRRVRLVAPGKWMLCASFILPRSVAFANRTMDL